MNHAVSILPLNLSLYDDANVKSKIIEWVVFVNTNFYSMSQWT